MSPPNLTCTSCGHHGIPRNRLMTGQLTDRSTRVLSNGDHLFNRHILASPFKEYRQLEAKRCSPVTRLPKRAYRPLNNHRPLGIYHVATDIKIRPCSDFRITDFFLMWNIRVPYINDTKWWWWSCSFYVNRAHVMTRILKM